MFASPLPRRRHLARPVVAAVRARVARLTRPVPIAVAVGAAADATRSRSDLLLENALLRHQLVVLVRTVKRPRLTAVDRGLLVLLASQRLYLGGRAGRRAPGDGAALASPGVPAVLAAKIAASISS